MLARILSIPFVAMFLVFLYLTWEVDDSYAIYIPWPVVVLAVIYVLSPQINWWWYVRNPPELDGRMRQLFQQRYPFYHELSLENKKRFRERVALFKIGTEFMPQAMEEVPEDIKGFVAANAVRLTLGLPDYMFPSFEKVVIYPKPFPSPQYPKSFHASEIFQEDGVVLFSAQHLTLSLMEPHKYFNTGLYEYIKVFLLEKKEQLPQFVELPTWDQLEAISNFSQEAMLRWINLELEDLDVRAISIAHFFEFPVRFQGLLPGLYDQYAKLFNHNPQNQAQPIRNPALAEENTQN